MRAVEKGDIWDRVPLLPACLDWRPKLNKKVNLHVHGIPPRFFVTQLLTEH